MLGVRCEYFMMELSCDDARPRQVNIHLQLKCLIDRDFKPQHKIILDSITKNDGDANNDFIIVVQIK
jgi:hypothetical protein